MVRPLAASHRQDSLLTSSDYGERSMENGQGYATTWPDPFPCTEYSVVHRCLKRGRCDGRTGGPCRARPGRAHSNQTSTGEASTSDAPRILATAERRHENEARWQARSRHRECRAAPLATFLVYTSYKYVVVSCKGRRGTPLHDLSEERPETRPAACVFSLASPLHSPPFY